MSFEDLDDGGFGIDVGLSGEVGGLLGESRVLFAVVARNHVGASAGGSDRYVNVADHGYVVCAALLAAGTARLSRRAGL